MKFIVAQLGARMHYAVPRILFAHGMLSRLYTDVYAESPFVQHLHRLPRRFHVEGIQRLLERNPKDLSHEKIRSFPFFGLRYAARRARASTGKKLQDTHLWAGQRFNRRILQKGLCDADAVYVFNTAGREIMETANQRGMTSVMEQTIAPLAVERDLVREERTLHDDWVQSVDPPETDKYLDAMIERERAEWAEADLILCGSEFVKQGIESCGGPAEKCRIVPYGIPLDAPSSPSTPEAPSDRPLRILTVGTVGLRKGIPYVQDAARKLQGHAQFRVVGPIDVTDHAMEMLLRHVDLVGPVPRTEVDAQYQWADVFLLPSICEGSATVCYEALAHGLPIITTPNAGSIIRDQQDGFLVPVRDSDAIAERLVQLDEDRELLSSMSESASRRSQKGGLEAYAERLISALTSFTTPTSSARHER